MYAAIQLFHESGYNATSVQDIVSKAGLPKGSFYNHFKSKEDLAIASADAFYARVLALLDIDESTSAISRLRAFVSALDKEMRRYDYMRGCLVGNLASEVTDATPELKAHLSRHLDEATHRISIVVKQAQKAGEIDPQIPARELSQFLLNTLYGAIFGSKVYGTNRPMKLFERFALQPFLK